MIVSNTAIVGWTSFAVASAGTALVFGAAAAVFDESKFSALDWTLIIGVIGSQALLLATGVLTVVFRFLDSRAAQVRADKAEVATAKVAVAADKVADTLKVSTANREEVLEGIAKVGEAAAEVGKQNHILLNSNMGIQLSMNAALSRWKADREKTPENEAAAKFAEQVLADHTAKQLVVDARDSAVATKAAPSGLKEVAADVKEIKEDVKDVKEIIK